MSVLFMLTQTLRVFFLRLYHGFPGSGDIITLLQRVAWVSAGTLVVECIVSQLIDLCAEVRFLNGCQDTRLRFHLFCSLRHGFLTL